MLKLRLACLSGPVIPFVPVSPRNRPSLFSLYGMRERFYRVGMFFRTLHAYLKFKDAHAHINIFSSKYSLRGRPSFPQGSLSSTLHDVYQSVFSSILEGNTAALRKRVTPALYEV